MSIAQALCGGALLLHSLFSSIRVDGGHNDDPSLIDQLWKGNGGGPITDRAEQYTAFTRMGSFRSRQNYSTFILYERMQILKELL